MSPGPEQSVEFYFDPGCPWTWITSRWVAEVARARSFEVTWRTFSLWHRNEWSGNAIPEQYRSRLAAQFRGLRVIEAAYRSVAEGRRVDVG